MQIHPEQFIACVPGGNYGDERGDERGIKYFNQ